MSQALLTAKQFCAQANISLITAAQWRRDGRGPRWIRLPNSRSIRYPADAIDEWIASAGDRGSSKVAR